MTEHTHAALGRWTLAALVAGTAYILAYSNNVTLFYYFPMVDEWHWRPQSEALGPGITYFGWKTIGLLAVKRGSSEPLSHGRSREGKC